MGLPTVIVEVALLLQSCQGPCKTLSKLGGEGAAPPPHTHTGSLAGCALEGPGATFRRWMTSMLIKQCSHNSHTTQFKWLSTRCGQDNLFIVFNIFTSLCSVPVGVRPVGWVKAASARGAKQARWPMRRVQGAVLI
jgi:hypothetical protein